MEDCQMPKKKINKKNWFIRHKISTVIIVLVLLFLIIPTNGKKSSPKATIDNTNQTSQSSPAKTEEKTTVATKPAEPEIIYNLTANANVINGSIVGTGRGYDIRLSGRSSPEYL